MYIHVSTYYIQLRLNTCTSILLYAICVHNIKKYIAHATAKRGPCLVCVSFNWGSTPVTRV